MSEYTELKKKLRNVIRKKYGVIPQIELEHSIYTKNFKHLIGYGDNITKAIETAYRYEGIKINRNDLKYDYENGFTVFIYNEEICRDIDIDHDFGYTREEALKNLLNHFN